MKGKPILVGLLSLLIPGLGQMLLGKGERGALILIAVIVVGNLNAIWLNVYASSILAPVTFYSTTLPRVLHDVFALYGIVFLIWQVVDAYKLAARGM